MRRRSVTPRADVSISEMRCATTVRARSRFHDLTEVEGVSYYPTAIGDIATARSEGSPTLEGSMLGG